MTWHLRLVVLAGILLVVVFCCAGVSVVIPPVCEAIDTNDGCFVAALLTMCAGCLALAKTLKAIEQFPSG